jgi:hypothetical protein
MKQRNKSQKMNLSKKTIHNLSALITGGNNVTINDCLPTTIDPGFSVVRTNCGSNPKTTERMSCAGG